MSSPSSNMISKNYCPNCESFDLVKVHRSFIQKRILRSANNLQCQSCEKIISADQLITNIPKAVPMFIESGAQKKPIIEERATAIEKSDTPKIVKHPPIKRKGISGWVYLTLCIGALAGLGYFSFENLTKSDSIIQNTAEDVLALQAQEHLLELPSQEPPESEKVSSHLTSLVAPTTSTPMEVNSEPYEVPESPSVKTETIQSENSVQTALNAPVASKTIPELSTTVELQALPPSSIDTPEVEAIVELNSTIKISPTAQTVKVDNKTEKIRPQSNTLLEKAAIEFIKQDLDTLFQ